MVIVWVRVRVRVRCFVVHERVLCVCEGGSRRVASLLGLGLGLVRVRVSVRVS